VRSVIETALQLLPEDKQLAAIRPRIDHAPAAGAAAAAAAANSSRGMQQHQQIQQQQRLKSAGSLPHYRQQQNGGLVNGAEPLSRCVSAGAALYATCSLDCAAKQQQQQHGSASTAAAAVYEAACSRWVVLAFADAAGFSSLNTASACMLRFSWVALVCPGVRALLLVRSRLQLHAMRQVMKRLNSVLLRYLAGLLLQVYVHAWPTRTRQEQSRRQQAGRTRCVALCIVCLMQLSGVQDVDTSLACLQ
jgi:hypothetical protein